MFAMQHICAWVKQAEVLSSEVSLHSNFFFSERESECELGVGQRERENLKQAPC